MNERGSMRVNITRNGPYVITGGVPLAEQVIETDAEGQSREWRQGRAFETANTYRLCRCGQSSSKPFCDDTHLAVGFDGSETASRQPYLERAKELDGPAMLLTDAEELCAFARFCDPDGGVWSLIEETDQPEKRELVGHEASHCVGGRLVAWDKTPRHPLEPALEPSLGLVEDPHLGVSGPIRVMGGILVRSGDWTMYEARNRVALCRCGGSENKPFCDGTHASIHFADGSSELAP